MNKFHKFSFITTIATFILIFVGGLVRVSGAGLGCPDWPTCFGRWFPPTSLSQLPADIDPATFNITLAWIEYINRLSGMLVGILILVVALWAIKSFRDNKKILYPAMLAAVLTAFQGWQGSVVVSSLLQPVIVSVHMLLALIIVCLLIYVTTESHYQINKASIKTFQPPSRLKVWIAVLWWMAVIQVMLGTQVRSAIEKIVANNPALESGEWLSMVGGINHMHMTVGILLAAFSFYAFSKFIKIKEALPPSVWQAVIGLMIIVTLQILLGLSFIGFDMTPIRQVFHMFFGSLYAGIVVYLYISIRRAKEPV